MDLSILHWIQDFVSHPVLIQLFRMITSCGNGGIIWIVFAAVLFYRKKYKEAFFLLLTLGVTSLIVNLGLKYLINRPRPFITDPTLIPRIAPPSSSSFPSGHSATSMCCAAFLFRTEKNWFGKSACALGILICLSRLVLLVHYPSDVCCGALIGILISDMMLRMMKKQEMKI